LHQHPPLSAREAHALTIDLAGAAAAATLMLVLTCWMLSLGGAFQPGHVVTHAVGIAASAPGAGSATSAGAARAGTKH
jgi:hypothetical protein